jgi:hypothetical protein
VFFIAAAHLIQPFHLFRCEEHFIWFLIFRAAIPCQEMRHRMHRLSPCSGLHLRQHLLS